MLRGVLPGRPARERIAALATAGTLLFATPMVPTLARLTTLAHHRFGLTAPERRAYQDRVSHGGGYPKLARDLALSPLRGSHPNPGPIWVLGNPLYYWLSGREQAVARNGASFIEYMTPEEWVALTADLARARPAYIVIQADYHRLLVQSLHPEAASFEAWLGGNYVLVKSSARSTWYAPRPALAGH